MGDETVSYLVFCARITPASVEAFVSTVGERMRRGVETLHLALSSPGGSVDAAISVYHLLRGLPMHVVTHNIGRVDSMGNVLFLAGDERYACPHTSFLFHGVGFNVDGRTRFDLAALREKTLSVEGDQRKIASILEERTGLGAERIERLFDRAEVCDPEFARKHGIIDDVRPLSIPAGAHVAQIPSKG